MDAERDDAVARRGGRDRRRHRRRPAAPRLHVLPSGAVDRGARRADAAPARRPDHGRRSRARSWCPSRRSPSASCAPSARWPRRACRSRCRAAPSWRRGSRRCSRSSTSIFNEGYSATAGDDWMRPALCEDALRLGRILAELAPREPEVHGLVALMEIQASRARARRGPTGEPILLLDQDRARWDQLLIRRGLAALERAEALGGARGPVRAAGRDRRLSRARAHAGRDRLGAHRRPLRRARRADAVADRRAQSRGRARDGMGPAAGLAIVDDAARRAGARALPPAAQRARRPARSSWAASTRRAPSSNAPPR